MIRKARGSAVFETAMSKWPAPGFINFA
jgi:hypothetical protein